MLMMMTCMLPTATSMCILFICISVFCISVFLFFVLMYLCAAGLIWWWPAGYQLPPPFASISSYRPSQAIPKHQNELKPGAVWYPNQCQLSRPALNLIQKVVINSRYHQTALKPDIGGRINRWWIVEITLRNTNHHDLFQFRNGFHGNEKER